MPKYEGWFFWYDYEDFVEPTLLRFCCKQTKDPSAHLSDDDIDCPKRIMFSNPLVKRPKEYPKEFNHIPPENPLESVTFKMLNTRVL